MTSKKTVTCTNFPTEKQAEFLNIFIPMILLEDYKSSYFGYGRLIPEYRIDQDFKLVLKNKVLKFSKFMRSFDGWEHVSNIECDSFKMESCNDRFMLLTELDPELYKSVHIVFKFDDDENNTEYGFIIYGNVSG